MGLKAAIQALKKAEELKARVSRHNDLLNNSEAWSDQQQLQTVYHQVLVLDLEYALDKKVEQELWTLGFKNHIAALQHLSRDKKNARRSECQALLSWCLEAASGFYLTLLQELCSAFELDLPFRRRGAVYGQSKQWPNSEQLTQPHKSSCLYICQYCLVHLGDIARYRSQRKQAETFYQHAILLSPSSGQPYNQLALLEASRGDKLATVYHYVRSISVKHPFPAAATNLSNTLLAIIDNNDDNDIFPELHSKLSLTEFITIFLRVHGLLHLATNLEQAELCVRTLNTTFTALVATKAFSAAKLIQMTAINLYALRHTLESFTSEQLSDDELRVKNLILELLAGAFSAYLLPIYTMSNDSALLEYYALPAIKLTLAWLKTDPDILNQPIFTKRLQLWPSLSKLLNSIQSLIGDFETKNHEKIPLPEDRDLQCFLPLVNAFKDLDFTTEYLNKDGTYFNKLRILRLVHLGVWLSNQTVENCVLITAKKMKNPTRVLFEPANQQPDPTTELLEELKHFSIKDEPKELKKTTERRGGILKPQGSLEKAREERDKAVMFSENGESAQINKKNIVPTRSEKIIKRTRQNVALQALAKKIEETNKQVTFQTEPKEKPLEPLPKPELLPKMNLSSDILQIPFVPNVHQSIPMPPKQQQQPESSKYPQNMSLFNNNQTNFPRPTMNVSNIPFSVPFNYHNNIPPPNYPRQQPFPAPPPMQTTPQPHNFNLPNFDVPPPNPIVNNFPPATDQFNSWMRDDKLPMPPSNWWTTNQKPVARTYPAQHDPFNANYAYNMNAPPQMPTSNLGNFMSDSGVKQQNLEFTRPYNGGIGNNAVYNNTSMWNSGPNVQNNLQMLLNQNGPPMMQNQAAPQQSFGELNKMAAVSRDTNAMHTRDTSDNQNNSMPGYSLFNSNWAPNLTVHAALKNSPPDRPGPIIRQQSLFSGPGPSPLERLLEQQKQLRGAKEDT